MIYLAQGTNSILYWVIGFIVLLLLLLVIFMLKFLNLWVQAYLSRAKTSLFSLVGMQLRRVNPTVIVRAQISAIQAGMEMNVRDLEAHFLAGGNVINVIRALIAAGFDSAPTGRPIESSPSPRGSRRGVSTAAPPVFSGRRWR